MIKTVKPALEKLKKKISQTEMPRCTLEESLLLAQKLFDDFAGKAISPQQLAKAVNISPSSTNWQKITGASVAYGLTDGAYNAANISLTALGKKIVDSQSPSERRAALIEACLRPVVINKFYERYNRNKFPSETSALSIIENLGMPKERLKEAFEIIKNNGVYVGVLNEIKNSLYVEIEVSPIESSDTEIPIAKNNGTEITSENNVIEELSKADLTKQNKVENNKVFITHGKNREIVDHLKKLLIFSKLQPIVAEDHETTSKPVPEKVLDDMRDCFGGIIHICSEEELLDSKGNPHHKINENVLIEVGAAMALYKKNFILLVQKGIHLPSNLQGLYLCYYEGEKLDVDATMKLLQAFNEFK